MKILVTGASGFVAEGIIKKLIDEKHSVYGSIRNENNNHSRLPESSIFHNCSLSSDSDWHYALTGIDIVVHTAARVHVMREKTKKPLDEYMQVNVDGTLNLAKQAIEEGVRRFIFISTAKVNGEETDMGKIYFADDAPHPVDPYAISKLEAETRLFQLGSSSSMDIVVIRPPLVYGPGVKANFLSMMKWVDRGIPLPLGCIDNKRSMVSLTNLADLVSVCVCHPGATNQVFMASDGEDMSTTELLRKLGKAMGHPAKLFPVSPRLLECGARIIGKQSIAQRLLGSLQVDISKDFSVLGWKPPVAVDIALHETALFYKEKQKLSL